MQVGGGGGNRTRVRGQEKGDGARLPLPGRDYPPNPLPLRVPWSPPPSRGDIVETAPTRGFPFR